MQTIKMDFQSQSTPPVVPVMQSDAQSRFIGITLYNGGVPYESPEGASYTVQYRGPGPNNMGWYDTITLSSGTRKAVTVDSTNKNIITLELAEQALRVNGNVFINLCVVTSTGYMLHTFPILCRVTGAAYVDPVAVRSFFYVTGITSEQWLAYVTACQDAQNRAEAAAATFQTDPTLSVSGKAADAAKVGESVGQLKEDLENHVFYNIAYDISKTGAWLDNTGNEVQADGWSASNYIDVAVENIYTIEGITTPTVLRKYALYDEKREFTRFIENNTNEHSLNVTPKYNERYIRLSIRFDDALKILNARNVSKNDYRINDKLNAKYFGAVGNASVDDTGAIQYALNLAKETGATVYLPVGKYLIKNLEIPANVTLLGENGKTSPEGLGSVLYCTDRDNPAIILNSRSSIKNIAFFYPRQRIVNDFPVTYPETIKLTDANTTTLVEIDNVNLINAYYAINATARHEKLRVNNVYGYAINKGLFIDGSTDVDIVSNVHLNYNTLRNFYDESTNEKFESFTARLGVAYQFGRCDTAIIQNIFAYGYRIGMQLVTSVTASKKLPPTYTIFTNTSMDTCNYPLWVGNASHVLFDNFVGISNNHTGDYSDVKACVYITGGDGICMSNSILTGFGNMLKTSGNDIALSNCDIRNYNREGATEAGFAIETNNGDIAINNSIIIGSTNRVTGFVHGNSNANSITVTGCIVKNITMQGKLIQVDNVDTIITQGLNTLVNSDGVIN